MEEHYGGGSRPDKLEDSLTLLEGAIRTALKDDGYGWAKVSDSKFDILYHGPFGWRKYIGKPPLVLGFVIIKLTSDDRAQAHITTFGERPSLTRTVLDCAAARQCNATSTFLNNDPPTYPAS